ncbi:MAG: type II toxin-antitoxin system prevent-host-death family antitoxin [Solirubrobacterales bacterium]|nr:type II toxin-antitoxin system prevent-host-death family antitoxin [Solirubrobacterales bacterium]
MAVSIGADSCRVSLGYWLDRVAAGQDVVVTRRGKPMVRLTAAAPAPEPPVSTVAPQILAATVLPPLVPSSAEEVET